MTLALATSRTPALWFLPFAIGRLLRTREAFSSSRQRLGVRQCSAALVLPFADCPFANGRFSEDFK
jgi:hypothetical protein